MYGLMIVIGVAVANIVAVKIKKTYNFDINDFIILQAYAFLFAFIFAKIFYLFTNCQRFFVFHNITLSLRAYLNKH